MIYIKEEKQSKLIHDVLMANGLSKDQAVSASTVMRYADERGIGSHGLIMLKKYVERIESQTINKDPKLIWNEKSEIISILDGGQGIGHYLGEKAMNKAINIASEKSIGIVLVKNATHYGASGYYTELAALNGMVGFTTTNTMPLMAPTGGKDRVLGNNPISFGIPRKEENPIILDIATSTVAAGKLMLANQKGISIPLGWALDVEGNPTTDPYKGFEGGGSLLPMANHKGYGLSLIMDILAGVLTGAGFGKNVKHDNIGFVMIAIDIETIMSKDNYNKRMEDLIGMVKDPLYDIYLPGELEYKKKEHTKSKGININETLYKELKILIKDSNLSLNDYL